MKKVLLYSGGMDSWLIDKLWHPDVKLYVNLHTKYSKEEMSKLPDDVKVVELDMSQWEREDSVLPMRNLILLAIATNYGDEICIGATAGDRVLDQSVEFASMSEALLTYLYKKQCWTEERKIKVNLSHKNYTKGQLLRKYLQNGGDIDVAFNETFSCYHPHEGKECWSCEACARKYIAFAINGYSFDDDVTAKVRKYITEHILPNINNHDYDRNEEEKEILMLI